MNLGGLFATAGAFAKTSNMLKDEVMLLTPYTVNAAFACELYLKGLLRLQKDTLQELEALPRFEQHNLAKLYAILNETEKESLKSSVMQKLTSPQKNFEAYLDEISNAFKECRYAYENQLVEIIEEKGISYINVGFNKPLIDNREFFEAFKLCLYELALQALTI
jgi:hypothetical protein